MEDYDFSGYDLNDLGERLAVLAASTYVRAADGFYDVVSPKDLPEALPSLCEAYEAACPYGGIIEPDFDASMKKAGFVSYTYLGSGDTADVMRANHGNGHHYAMRLDVRFVDNRIVSPFIPQAFFTHDDMNTTDIKIETLPEVRMLQLRDLLEKDQDHYDLEPLQQETLSDVMRQFLAIAGNRNHLDLKDVGIYPDGTPVFVDPGQLDYATRMDHDTAEQKMSALHRISSVLSLPEQFRWFAADGIWKQDKFFADPFKRTPYYRGFSPLI